IEWLYRSQQYCGITYAANWMPNYTANAAQICTYYLPGSTASIGGGAILVNGNSRGAFVPESMSMSNWGVNMRGTARVRYIYWSQQVVTPVPTIPPPTATLAPLPALGTYHVECTLSTPANARNYPAGQTTPTLQIDGRVIMTFPQGTVLDVLEWRLARDNIYWARVTNWEFNGRDTLWIRMKQPNNVTNILVQGSPTTCAASTPNFGQPTVAPPTTATPGYTPYITAVPTCGPGAVNCDHVTHFNNVAQVDLVAWVIACEGFASGITPLAGAVEDAIANAHVVYNRMDSGLYWGTAYQVVTQSGQWQPYGQGCSLNPAINELRIRAAATAVVNGQEPQALPPEFLGGLLVDYLALYTYGFARPTNVPAPTEPSPQALIASGCATTATQALQVHVATAPFLARPNASVFFSDSPGCVLSP
ncbi:MAG: hypothetical protein SF123_17265, partial [Chloroflexota bacterium]|nr:hypothetical protein [Chloroflexota bacterium]